MSREAEKWGKRIEMPPNVQESLERKRKQAAREKIPVVMKDQINVSPADVPNGSMSAPWATGPIRNTTADPTAPDPFLTVQTPNLQSPPGVSLAAACIYGLP